MYNIYYACIIHVIYPSNISIQVIKYIFNTTKKFAIFPPDLLLIMMIHLCITL